MNHSRQEFKPIKSTLKMEVAGYFETLVHIQKITKRHISEDRNLKEHYFLGYDAVQSDRSSPTFGKNICLLGQG
jgi:hypothetical protein